MALSFNRREGNNVAKVTVDRRLWVDADGNLVEDGDPKAAFLWGVAGREVTAAEAERVGYQPKRKPGRPKGSRSKASDG